MYFHKLLTVIFLTTLVSSCSEEKKVEKDYFSIQIQQKKKRYHAGDTIYLSINNPEKLSIKSTTFSIHDVKLTVTTGNAFVLPETLPLGNQTISAEILYNETKTEISQHPIQLFSNTTPVIYKYEILNEYPHDIEAYTQGLEFFKDTLYESTGQRGKSSLRKTNAFTGEVYKKIDLDNQYFGEGLTIFNNKVLQLTWQSKVGFVYDVNTLKKESSFSFTNSIQGWGICNDGTHLYKSDGTEKIWFLDPTTYLEKDFIQLTSNTAIYNKANELEYVDGKIYANSYQNDGIMIIDPKNGAILGVVDCRGLREKVTQHSALDVLNGIAYHPTRNTFFITGKNWDKMFEVTLSPK